MDLNNISNVELVNRMKKLVRTERKITHLILSHILEIESRRIYAELGFDGMYTYLTRGLGYSEAAAYRRLQSARLLKQVPEVAEKIESGALHLSQLTKIQKCITAATSGGKNISTALTLDVLAKLEHKNSFETEKVLAQTFDLPVLKKEHVTPQQDESVRLEVTLTAEQFKQLEMAKNLLSHVCFEGSWADVISTLAEKFNRKTNTVVKEGAPKIHTPSTQRVIATRGKRKYISLKTRRSVLQNANARCEFTHGGGQSCGSRYQLQFDHIRPVALGGGDERENLRILCRTHNLYMAKQMGL